MTIRVLYITWDGPQTYYLEGLFLPIFSRLKAYDIEVEVIQFIWGDNEHLERQRRVCAAQGIRYQRIVVPRAAGWLGAYLAAAAGSSTVLRSAKEREIDILMPRSFMPAIAALHAIWRQARPRLPLVFDADGLAIDEKADFGRLSRSSPVYQLLKWYERAAITAASSVIGRTAAACDIYEKYDAKPKAGKYVVAVNGRDPEHFEPLTAAERDAARVALDIDPTVPLIVYCGAFGEKYCPSKMFRFFRGTLRQRPDAKFLIMTGSPEAAAEYIKINELDIRTSVRVRTATPQKMPPNLAAADLGLCFYKNTFSNRAFQATKLGEYLLCGLAVTGTTNALPFGLEDTCVARSVGLMSDDEIDAVASWFVCDVLGQREAIRSEARRLGKAHLSVDATVSSYARAIRRAVLAT
jgi:glycosyltransferase involved in cell wall biosynthesis